MGRHAVASILVFSAAVSAFADIGPKPTSTGRTPGPSGPDVEGVAVVMAEEAVDLMLRRVAPNDYKLEVRAVFRMRNDGETATFETGFPVGAYKNMEDFSVQIDGKRVDLDVVDRGAAPSPKDAVGGTRLDPYNDYWYVWPATYRGHAVSTHEVRYTVDLVSQSWNGTGSAGYVLHSGAGWKGPIGKAVVTLRMGPGLTFDNLIDVVPQAGATRHEDRIVWSFTDFEPTQEHDIRVGYSDRTVTEELAKVREEAKTKWSGRTRVVLYLECAQGARLRKRTDPELAEYLDALAALVAERKVEGDRVVLPGSQGDDRRDYVSSPNSLFSWMDRTADTVEAYPASARAREVLAVYVDLAERFLAGRLVVDGAALSYPWHWATDTPEQRARRDAAVATRRAKLERWLERARRVLSVK